MPIRHLEHFQPLALNCRHHREQPRKTRLFVGPNWKEVIIDAAKGDDFIHSEVIDVDADGDLDFIGARFQPGLIIWFERPAKPLTDSWPLRIVSNELNGIHGLLTGDVDRDG